MAESPLPPPPFPQPEANKSGRRAGARRAAPLAAPARPEQEGQEAGPGERRVGDGAQWYERRQIPHIVVGEDEGRRAMIVDGAVHSVAPDDGHRGSGYWAAMIPDQKPQRALILGLGAGTVAHLLTRRFGPVPIVGVDDDPEVIETARREFDLSLANLRIEIGDAFAYVAATSERYDLILVDLYRGGRPAPGMLSARFIAALKRVLLPHGQAVFNCFSVYLTPERLARLQSSFRLTSVVPAGSNRILFCRL